MGVVAAALPDHSFRRLINFGPLFALFLIFFISIVTVSTTRLWWPLSSPGSSANVSVFVLVVCNILYNYLRAVFVGPGYLPIGWEPRKQSDRRFLQYCEVCCGYKAPRAHHCRKCNRCVEKMDHHCPWLGNCLGHDNHANFLFFLGFVVTGCAHAVGLLAVGLFRMLFWSWMATSGEKACRKLHRRFPDQELFAYKTEDDTVLCSWSPRIDLTAIHIICGIAAFTLALALAIALFFMFVSEMTAVSRNRTGIEEWIEEKANHRRSAGVKKFFANENVSDVPKNFVYPYDLGWEENLSQVLWHSSSFGPRDQRLDGITWPTLEGCDPYELTREQLAQKAEKKKSANEVVAVQAYSGQWCAAGYHWKVKYAPFWCMSEERLPLEVKETVKVTREEGKWMYGWRDPPRKKGPQEKGWFPSAAVRPVKKSR